MFYTELFKFRLNARAYSAGGIMMIYSSHAVCCELCDAKATQARKIIYHFLNFTIDQLYGLTV